MIRAEDLVEKCRYALENKWGYIWGASGEQWTQAKQNQKVNYMVNKYGTGWKNNSEAKDDKYYSSALYGDKWIGKNVVDCSGLLCWAFKQLGGSIYHGSNSIWDRYCARKGKLSGGKATDGHTLIPGTAVFTGTDEKKPHVGVYAGSGKVIEAAGTKSGVITSDVGGKWQYWGELKDVEYEEGGAEDPGQADLPILRRGSKGEYVTLVQTALVQRGYDIGSYGVDGNFGKMTEAAVRQFQQDWGLKVDGIVGPRTYEILLSTPATIKKYTVTICGLDLAQAKALTAQYPENSEMKEGSEAV